MGPDHTISVYFLFNGGICSDLTIIRGYQEIFGILH